MKTLKKLIIIVISLFLLLTISLEVTYRLYVPKTKEYLIPSKNIYSQVLKDAVFSGVEAGPEFVDNKFTPLRFMYKYLINGDSLNSLWGPESMSAKDQLSVMAASFLIKDYDHKTWYLDYSTSTIWISKNLSLDEIIATYLDNHYYGNDASSIQEASDLYFKKKVNELTINESVALVATLAHPVKINLYCDQEELEEIFFYYRDQLVSYWPERYAEHAFVLPKVELPETPEALECNQPFGRIKY